MTRKYSSLTILLGALLALLFVGCSSGDSEKSGGECTDSERKCADDGLTVLRCEDGKWAELYKCNEGFVCSAGKCEVQSSDGDTDAVAEQDVIDFVIPDGDTSEEEEEEARGCVSDRDCVPVSDYYCDRSSGFGVCRRRLGLCDPCESHLQCGMNQDMCITDPISGNKVCGSYCVSDYECPNGFVCQSNQCVLTQAGIDSGACCVNENCTDPSKPVCNPTTHRCFAGCHDDMECPSGQVCANGVCKDGCASSQDCAAGTVCDPDTRQCIPGECITKYDCPLEHLCNEADHTCYEGCENDNDCMGSNECKERDGHKICVERTGCRHTGDCKLGMFCDFDQPDPDNPDRGTCRTLYPEGGPYSCCSCAQNEDCNFNGQEGYCVEMKFEDEDGNPIPGKVNYKTCVFPVDCKRRDDDGNLIGSVDCPRGFTCGELTVSSQSGEQKYGICVTDCNEFCTVPYFDEVNICGEAGLPSVCPLEE